MEAVKELLNWDRWYKPKPDGSFDMELFCAVASMCTEKGLPSLEAVIAELASLEEGPDGSFNIQLFRAVASMCTAKGLPNLEAGTCLTGRRGRMVVLIYNYSVLLHPCVLQKACQIWKL